MRFLHLSDLHLGLKLLNHDLMEDQAYILEQVVRQVQELQPDAVVIAGDIYDKAIPPAEAVDLFDRFVSELCSAAPNTRVMIISGNHDSAPRLNLFRSLLQRHRVHMIGQPPMQAGETIEKVVLSDDYGPVNFYLLPFVKPSMIKAVTGADDNGNNLSYQEAVHRLICMQEVNQEERNVLVSHQYYVPEDTDPGAVERMDNEIRAVGNVDAVGAGILQLFDYAALGHIHKSWPLDTCHRYCGTPMACSISEAGQSKGTVLVEMGAKGDIAVQVLPLHPLRQVRVLTGTLEEVLRERSEDYVSIVLTDKADLDVFDLQDRINDAFPNHLGISRSVERTADYSLAYTPEAERDPFALCSDFLKDLDAEEQALLQDIINSVKEEV